MSPSPYLCRAALLMGLLQLLSKAFASCHLSCMPLADAISASQGQSIQLTLNSSSPCYQLSCDISTPTTISLPTELLASPEDSSAGSQPVVDLDSYVFSSWVLPGARLVLRGLQLQNAVLPSKQAIASGLVTSAPLAFNISGAAGGAGSPATLQLDGCTVLASTCSNLAQFLQWLTDAAGSDAVLFGKDGSSWAFIRSLTWGPVSYSNTNVTCTATSSGGGNDGLVSTITATASDPQQLLPLLRLVGQLQPATIILPRSMRIPPDWPGDGLVISKPLLLQGPPSPAPRTILDLYQVHTWLSLDFATILTIRNVQLMNLCGVYFVPNAQALPMVSYVSTVNVWAIDYSRNFRGVQLQNCTIVVPYMESQQGWLGLMALKWGHIFTRYSLLAKEAEIRLSSPEGFVQVNSSSATFRTMETLSNLNTNVTMVNMDMEAGDDIAVQPLDWCRPSTAQLPPDTGFFAESLDEVVTRLDDITKHSTDSTMVRYTTSVFPYTISPLLDVSVAEAVRQAGSVVIAFPVMLVGQTVPLVLGGPMPSTQTLDLRGCRGCLLLAGSSAHVYLGALRLTGLESAGVTAANSSIADGMTLPLWAFGFERTAGGEPRLHLHNVTIELPRNEFAGLLAQLRSLANTSRTAGLAGLSTSLPAVAPLGSASLEVEQASSQAIVLNRWEGWGFNATALTLLPDTPLPPDNTPPGGSQDPPWGSPPSSGSSDGLSSGAVAGIVVGCVVGSLTLLAAGWWLLAHTRRGASSAGGQLPRKAVAVNGGGSSVSHRVGSYLDPEAGGPRSEVGGATGSSSRAGAGRGRSTTSKLDSAPATGQGGPEGAEGAASSGSSSAASTASPSRSRHPPPPAAAQAVAAGSGAGHGSNGLQPGVPAGLSSGASREGGGSQVSKSLSGPSQSTKSARMHPADEVRQMIQDLGTANKLVVLNKIGSGGFGTVYRGTWCNLEVAVKTMIFQKSPEGPDEAVGLKQLALREAAVCCSMSHPNIVATYHYEVVEVAAPAVTAAASGLTITDDHGGHYKLYLIQELCHMDLQDLMEEATGLYSEVNNAPYLAMLVPLLLDVAAGMQYLHSRNIVHGDLTLNNVLVKVEMSSSGQEELITKITDFGLCEMLNPGQTHVSKHNKGTPFFVAPEVLRHQQVTKASDVYCYGILMWCLYNRSPPYVVDERSRRHSLHPRFPHFPPSCPPEFKHLAMGCLHPDLTKRPTFNHILAFLHAKWVGSWQSTDLEDQQEQLQYAQACPAPAPAQLPQAPGGAGGDSTATAPRGPSEAFPATPGGTSEARPAAPASPVAATAAHHVHAQPQAQSLVGLSPPAGPQPAPASTPASTPEGGGGGGEPAPPLQAHGSPASPAAVARSHPPGPLPLQLDAAAWSSALREGSAGGVQDEELLEALQSAGWSLEPEPLQPVMQPLLGQQPHPERTSVLAASTGGGSDGATLQATRQQLASCVLRNSASLAAAVTSAPGRAPQQ